MDGGKGGGRLARLVRLEVANQMPPYRYIGRALDLLQGFLNFVFTEVALAGRVGGANIVRAEGLRDGQKPDVSRIAPRRPRGRINPRTDRREVDGDV